MAFNPKMAAAQYISGSGMSNRDSRLTTPKPAVPAMGITQAFSQKGPKQTL